VVVGGPQFEDLTEDWRQYTTQRVAKWDADHDRLVRVHREDTFNRLRYFYNVVRELYAGTCWPAAMHHRTIARGASLFSATTSSTWAHTPHTGGHLGGARILARKPVGV
jgi:hypothetical protein